MAYNLVFLSTLYLDPSIYHEFFLTEACHNIHVTSRLAFRAESESNALARCLFHLYQESTRVPIEGLRRR